MKCIFFYSVVSQMFTETGSVRLPCEIENDGQSFQCAGFGHDRNLISLCTTAYPFDGLPETV